MLFLGAPLDGRMAAAADLQDDLCGACLCTDPMSLHGYLFLTALGTPSAAASGYPDASPMDGLASQKLRFAATAQEFVCRSLFSPG